MRLPALILFATLLAATSTASAETFNVGPADDLFGTLRGLNPGDEVIVADGTYTTPGFFEVTWNGTEAQPILVRAADGARPVIQGDPSQNVINAEGTWWTLRGFEITGGSHGIRLGNASNATIEDNSIHDIAGVGVSCNRPGNRCDAIVVRRNEIYNTGGNGEGMYIGCNDDACQVSNSLFEQNYIHDLGGDQGDGIEIKTGSWGNTVRDNVIIDANYPAITMYGYPVGAGPVNVVERNFVWGTVDNGIQVVGQVVVRNNIVIDAGTNGIQSKPSQGFDPHDVEIVHNTIWNAGDACMKTNGWDGQANQLIANNALYCAGGLAVDINGGAPAATMAGNMALGEVRGPGGFMMGGGPGDLGDPAMTVLYPPSGSPLIDAGDPAHGVAEDYNGTARDDGMPDIGAYEHAGDPNPGWMLGRGFRGEVPDPPPDRDAGMLPPGTDAGMGGRRDGGGTTDGGGGDDGCGCGTAGGGGPAWPVVALALALLLARRRRTG